MIIIAEIGLVMCAIFLSGGILQLSHDQRVRKSQSDVLAIALHEMQLEMIRAEKEQAIQQKEAREQEARTFYMDVKIMHGSAFGGFCATRNDGRKKHGSVLLDHILLHGRHPSGKEYTYYIEDQNIEICATDKMNELLIRSKGAGFEIRQEGQSRDEGHMVQSALIRRDILYYLILESKHEISIKAVKGC